MHQRGIIRNFAALAITYSGLLCSMAHAQNVTRAWVDPCRGNDSTGTLNMNTAPFLTITAAQDALAALPLDSMNQGLVIALPGIYSPGDNSETLPIRMRSFVHVRGVGARQCILRGSGDANRSVFLPVSVPPATGGVGTTGMRTMQEVLVEFRETTGREDAVEMLDGFTLQGGDVQVYVETEAQEGLGGGVANCVFDMIDGRAGLTGPLLGTLIVQDQYAAGTYNWYDFHLIHNTYVQGTVTTDNAPEPNPVVSTAIVDSVAICRVNDPNSVGFSDNDQSLRGLGLTHISNCLIRSVTTQPQFGRTAFLGVNSLDVRAYDGSIPAFRNTNAFDSTLVGGSNQTGTLFSSISSGPPAPMIDLLVALNDPKFVGEALASAFATPGSNLINYRDWRILPDSPLVDQGLSPDSGFLISETSLFFLDPANESLSTFEWDGEHYGNPRLIDVADIGFDEVGQLILAGSYANDSNQHNGPVDSCPVLTDPGSPDMRFIFPSSIAQLDLWMTAAPFGPYGPVCSSPPGSVPGVTTCSFPLTFLAGSPVLFLDSMILLVIGPFVPGTVMYLNLVSQQSLSMSTFSLPLGGSGATPASFVNFQFAYMVVTGGGNLQAALTNLQSSRF